MSDDSSEGTPMDVDTLPEEHRSRKAYTGDISRLLFKTARPGLEGLIFLLFAATLVYSLVAIHPINQWMLALLICSYIVSALSIRLFPYEEWHPVLFFGMIVSFLAFLISIVYFTGGRTSLLGFMFLIVPLFAAHYYSYTGTAVAAFATSVACLVPYMGSGVTGIQWLSVSMLIAAFFVSGLVVCYVVEGENVYAKESLEFRRMLDGSISRERQMRLIYELSRRFSYTLDLDTILKTTASLARKLLSSEGSLVFLLEDGKPVLKAALGAVPFTDLAGVTLPEGQSWVNELANGGLAVSESVSLGWLPLPERPHGRLYDIAAVPMFIGSDVVGYLMAFSRSGRAGFSASQFEILSTLAGQAAMAVDKARLYSRTVEDKAKDETILGAIRDGLLVADHRGELVQLNPVAEMMLSLDEPAEGRPLLEVLESSVIKAELGTNSLETALESALEGNAAVGELKLRGEGDITVQAHFIPLTDQLAGVTGIVLFLHDITELKRVDEMKSNFASNVSHELRTPLTSITGYVSLLLAGRAGALTQQQNEFLEVIKKQSQNLARMIEDLLDFSRRRDTQAAGPLEAIGLSGAVQAALERLEHATSVKDIEVRVSIPQDLPAVAAQQARLERVAGNMIENAIKFSEAGSFVEVGAASSGEVVQVTVSDQGCGIPSSDLPHVFDRFFQAPTGASAESGGFGLGLAICREIIESFGGDVRAESEEGAGSTFYFTIPVYDGDERQDGDEGL